MTDDGALPDLDGGQLPETVRFAVLGAVLTAITLNAPADGRGSSTRSRSAAGGRG